MGSLTGAADLESLPPEQREALLDAGQIALDVIGCLEPTPFADTDFASAAALSITSSATSSPRTGPLPEW